MSPGRRADAREGRPGAVPTVLGVGGYRFFFYSNERDESPHAHVSRERMLLKLWLRPVRPVRVSGLAPHEVNRIRRLTERHRVRLMEAWDAFFE